MLRMNKEYFLSGLMVFLIVLLLFLPILMGQKGIFHDDQAFEEFSRHYFVAHSLQNGIIPRWDPNTWCGAIPFYGRYYSETYYFPRWPFYFMANLNNIDQAYWVLILAPLFLHFLLAGAGMFILLRVYFKCGYISTLLGVLAYLYSPAFTYSYLWQQIIFLLSWAPWLFVVYFSFCKRPKLWKAIIGSMIVGCIITSASPSYWPSLTVLFSFACISNIISFVYKKEWYKTRIAISFVVFIIVIGVVMGSVYLFSFFDAMKYTTEHIKLTVDSALLNPSGSMHPFFLSTLILPNLFGNLTGEYFDLLNPVNRVSYWETNLTGGVCITFLVFVTLVMAFKREGIFKEKYSRRCIIFLFFMILFSLFAIMGKYTPFYRYTIGLLPLVGQLPNPIRYRMLYCMVVPVILAVGFNNLILIQFTKKKLIKYLSIYFLFSFVVVSYILVYPIKYKSRAFYAFPKEQSFVVDSWMPINTAIGANSPNFVTDKIMLSFNQASKGRIFYGDKPGDDLNQGELVCRYDAEKKGVYSFNVLIPPKKFVWLVQDKGNASIGFEKTGIFTNTFYYDEINRQWEKKSYINAVSFLKNTKMMSGSLLRALKDKGIVKKVIINSLIYFFFSFVILFIVVYFFSTKKVGYIMALCVILEFFVFGHTAFYSPRYNNYKRYNKPSEHPVYKRTRKVSDIIAENPFLRISCANIYHDNFMRLNNHFALMGFEMHPLETRFRRAVEIAYGKPINWDIIFDSLDPGVLSFLTNFSVGYILDTRPVERDPFLKYHYIPDSQGFYISVNRNPLPRVYTLDNVVYANEEEQLFSLITHNLTDAVYINPDAYENRTIKNVVKQKKTSNYDFGNLQKLNEISELNMDNPNKIEINVDMNIPAMMILTEIWYPGWHLYVDGKKAPLYRVNYCQRGFWLEKGAHKISLIFLPWAWKKGFAISMITVISLIMYMVFYAVFTVIKK